MADDLFGYGRVTDQKKEEPSGKGSSSAFSVPALNGHLNKTKKETKEERPLDRLKDLEEKIALAINKVRVIKEEKAVLEQRMRDLEARLIEKDREIEMLLSEKTVIRDQIGELIDELEGLEPSKA